MATALVSGVVLAFVIPLFRLVSETSDAQLTAATTAFAHRAATLVGSIDDPGRQREELVALAQSDPAFRLTVYPPTGPVWGDERPDPVRDTLVAQARAGGASFTQATEAGPHSLAAVQVPQGLAVVHVSADRAPVRGGVYAAWLTLGLLGALLLVASILVARRLGDRISTPVTEMAQVAHRLRSGDLAARAKVEGPAEVVELGSALNRLAERIGELLEIEREAAADLSHRLRTPVTALRLDTDLVADPAVAVRLRDHVEELHRAIDSIVADARRSVRDVMGGRCDARAVLAERAHHWGPLAEDQGRTLTLVPPDPGEGAELVWVPLAEQDLRDLLDNLLDNVFAHTPEAAPIRLGLSLHGATVLLRVEDGGAGGPQSVLLGRGESTTGTGLGLDIVSRLARAAGGSLTFERSQLGGLAAVVRMRALGGDREV